MFRPNVYIILLAVVSALNSIEADDPSTRIVGGAIVRSIRNFPYVASIQSDAGFFCAGTIIAPYWILSASHCLVAFERVRVFIKIPYKIGNIKIRVGSLRNDRDGWLFDVRNYFLHEAFAFDARTSKVASYDNDIALLQTNERIRLAVTAAVMKIRLPPAAFEAKNGTQLNVVGWGRLKAGNSGGTRHMNRVTMPLIDRRTCQRKYGDPNGSLITANMLCAGRGIGRDACNSDSGGPITTEQYVIGIVSFGKGCGSLPGVYTNVVNYLQWIEKLMEKHDGD